MIKKGKHVGKDAFITENHSEILKGVVEVFSKENYT